MKQSSLSAKGIKKVTIRALNKYESISTPNQMWRDDVKCHLVSNTLTDSRLMLHFVTEYFIEIHVYTTILHGLTENNSIYFLSPTIAKVKHWEHPIRSITIDTHFSWKLVNRKDQ